MNPNGRECLEFWSEMWSEQANHNVDSEWLKQLEKYLKNVEKQDF